MLRVGTAGTVISAGPRRTGSVAGSQLARTRLSIVAGHCGVSCASSFLGPMTASSMFCIMILEAGKRPRASARHRTGCARLITHTAAVGPRLQAIQDEDRPFGLICISVAKPEKKWKRATSLWYKPSFRLNQIMNTSVPQAHVVEPPKRMSTSCIKWRGTSIRSSGW